MGWRRQFESRPAAERHRPLGVTILAVLDALGSVVALVLVFAAIGSLPSDTGPGYVGGPGYVSGTSTTIGGVSAATTDSINFLIFQGITGLIAALGLWLVHDWGRWVAVGRAAVLIVILLASVASQPVTGSVLLQVLVSVAVIVYLLQPGVRRAFIGEE